MRPIINNKLSSVPIEQVKTGGILGERLKASLEKRLCPMDEDMLLSGFESRPGKQAWIGEHAGKWIDAAVKTAVYFNDKSLKGKIKRVVKRLIKTQEPDGYMGTYLPDERWRYLRKMEKESWDVWVHKYCIIGLLVYYRCFGGRDVLASAEKAADLIIRTFGKNGSDINLSDHRGLASTAILSQYVDLWQITGKKQYLEFAEWIISRMEIVTGSHLVSRLREKRSVERIGDGKAYEMMSNFKGLLDISRVTGKREYIDLIQHAWEDILSNHAYITGGMSNDEFFMPDHCLPNTGKIEPCVTVTWMQFSLELLKLTGQSCYADAVEQTFYNQLLYAQNPDGQWYEHAPIHGRKRLIHPSGLHCCSSSGPRALTALVENVFCTDASNGIYVNFFFPGRAVIESPSGGNVEIQQETDYPASGKIVIKLRNRRRKKLLLHIRIPAWCARPKIRIYSHGGEESPIPGKYFRVNIPANKKEVVELSLDMPVRVTAGGYENWGSASISRGPVVYAFDESENSNLSLSQVVLDARQKNRQFNIVPSPKGTGWNIIKTNALLLPSINYWDIDGSILKKGKRCKITLIPFAFAGNRGRECRVWIHAFPAAQF